MSIKFNGAKVAIWGGPGAPPDDPGVWHTFEEYEANIAAFVASSNLAASNAPKGIDPRMIGSIWVKQNAAPSGRSFGDYRDGADPEVNPIHQ